MNSLRDMTTAQACLIGLLIAALVFFFVLGGIPNDKKVVQLKKKKQALVKKNVEADELIKEAKKYKNRLDNLGKTINKVIKYVPKDMSSIKLRKNLTNLAAESGMNIVGVTEVKTVSKNTSELYSEVPVQIKLEGRFTQVMIFLSKLTELENIVTMSDFNIKSGTSKVADGIISFSATFIGYKYKAVVNEVNKK